MGNFLQVLIVPEVEKKLRWTPGDTPAFLLLTDDQSKQVMVTPSPLPVTNLGFTGQRQFEPKNWREMLKLEFLGKKSQSPLAAVKYVASTATSSHLRALNRIYFRKRLMHSTTEKRDTKNWVLEKIEPLN